MIGCSQAHWHINVLCSQAFPSSLASGLPSRCCLHTQGRGYPSGLFSVLTCLSHSRDQEGLAHQVPRPDVRPMELCTYPMAETRTEGQVFSFLFLFLSQRYLASFGPSSSVPSIIGWRTWQSCSLFSCLGSISSPSSLSLTSDLWPLWWPLRVLRPSVSGWSFVYLCFLQSWCYTELLLIWHLLKFPLS